MFPYARDNAAEYLRKHWDEEQLNACLELLAVDAGQSGAGDWLRDLSPDEAQRRVVAAVHDLMSRDAKVTGLKKLQGMIWKSGFESGQLVSHVFDDVPPTLKKWHADGLDLRIYSSGSIQAQKLFFAHTTHGNLLPLLTNHYDTTSGGKKEATSYKNISNDIGVPPNRIVFLSDVVAELDAASSAGMQTVLSLRPGNADSGESNHMRIFSFEHLAIQKS
jgi:enolase-phosphatase E1